MELLEPLDNMQTHWAVCTAFGAVGVGMGQFNHVLESIFLLTSISGLMVNMIIKIKNDRKNGDD